MFVGGLTLNLKVVSATLIIALVVSLAFNLNYYLNLRVQDSNTVNNMRAKALYIYGYKFSSLAYHLEKYATSLESDVREEMEGDLEVLGEVAGLLLQGPRQPFYDVLVHAVGAVGGFVEFQKYFIDGFAVINATLAANVVELLRQIGHTFWDFDALKDEDPIQHLSSSTINTVTSKCEQLQALVRNL